MSVPFALDTFTSGRINPAPRSSSMGSKSFSTKML